MRFCRKQTGIILWNFMQIIFRSSYIQNELLLQYERSVSLEHREVGKVPAVRIVNAFVKFLNHASQIYDINIHRKLYEMDPLSIAVLKHIETSSIDNICIN